MKAFVIAFLLLGQSQAFSLAPNAETGIWIENSLWAETPGDWRDPFTLRAGSFTPGRLRPASGFIMPDSLVQHLDTKVDFGVIAAWATGLHIAPGVRVEAEASYLQHDVDLFRAFDLGNQDLDARAKDPNGPSPSMADLIDVGDVVSAAGGKVQIRTTFANAIYDIPTTRRGLWPYIGAGVGLAEMKMDFTPEGREEHSARATAPAYQAIAGLTYRRAPQSDLVLKIRHRAVGETGLSLEGLPQGLALSKHSTVLEFGYRTGF